MNLGKSPHLLLVCSTGGHLDQLYSLKEFWGKYERTWVTFKNMHSEGVLAEEPNRYWAYEPTNRNIKNLIRNLILALKLISSGKYTHILSTGAGVGVPFIWMGKLFGLKTIFIDSFTRTEGLSLSAKLIYYIADKVLTQWKSNTKKYKKVIYKGKVV